MDPCRHCPCLFFFVTTALEKSQVSPHESSRQQAPPSRSWTALPAAFVLSLGGRRRKLGHPTWICRSVDDNLVRMAAKPPEWAVPFLLLLALSAGSGGRLLACGLTFACQCYFGMRLFSESRQITRQMASGSTTTTLATAGTAGSAAEHVEHQENAAPTPTTPTAASSASSAALPKPPKPAFKNIEMSPTDVLLSPTSFKLRSKKTKPSMSSKGYGVQKRERASNTPLDTEPPGAKRRRHTRPVLLVNPTSCSEFCKSKLGSPVDPVNLCISPQKH